jgi:hypothetical protein
MVILKQVADQIILPLLFVTTVVIASVENVNVIQEKILRRLFLEIIASAITFLVTDIMGNFVPVLIMESANAANVLVIRSGIAQATLHVNVGPLMTHVSRHMESS